MLYKKRKKKVMVSNVKLILQKRIFSPSNYKVERKKVNIFDHFAYKGCLSN